MNILITGADSYVGIQVQQWITSHSDHQVATLDVTDSAWEKHDFSAYDVVYHVAGIAHRKATKENKDLYYRVNRDLTVKVAKQAKAAGVKQFIFMSSMSVFHGEKLPFDQCISPTTPTRPVGYYGDSKLQAEQALLPMHSDTFKICILRPPMIYGKGAKGNFPRLVRLAARTLLFPDFHNRRSMLYIDNLAEFVLQAINHQLSGTFYPQNRELSDTVEIIRYFAKAQNHKVWFAKWLNPFVRLASHFMQPINKMFGTYYYVPQMSQMPFDYQLVSFDESLKRTL